MASDGVEAESILWSTHDNCKTWYDTGGRTAGRHTSFTLLNDGMTILGMGGKNSDIDGFMPRCLTRDGGKSYEVSKTPFCMLGSNQRPSLLRLTSGRLFMAGDFNRKDGEHPASITEKGSYVALSDDDGENWLIRKLPGAELHEEEPVITIGYSVASWKNFKCEGTSTVWDKNGKVISRNEFANGRNTGQMSIAGTLIIESTESITAASNSILNGAGATITVNGGSFTVNGRFNLGTGSDGYINMNGGTFTVTGSLKFADGDGGVHRIYLNGGIMRAGNIEQKHDRDAIIYVGGGILRLDDITASGGDPKKWKDNGDLLPAEGYDDIVIEDCGDYTEVRAVKYPPTIQGVSRSRSGTD